MVTNDRGKSWQTQISGTERGLRHISCLDVNTCLAVGGDAEARQGVVLATINSGQTWTVLPAVINQYLENITCLTPTPTNNITSNSHTCFAVNYYGQIMQTTDLGVNWTVQYFKSTTHFSDIKLSCCHRLLRCISK